MMSRGLSRFALSVCAAGALLAGCGGSQPPLGAPGALAQTSAIATHAERGKSWMLPEAKSQDLFYVAQNSPGAVSVYTYPKGKPVGAITGISAPNGICADSQGNVFVVGTQSQQIYEFAHGGSQPINTLDDSGNDPQACAVDPLSGDLAVSGGLGEANVAIYPEEQGTPTVYKDPHAGGFTFCTYDSSGNLFMGGGVLVELPQGSSSFAEINVAGVYEFAAPGIQWDGTYIALQGTRDSKKGPTVIYRIRVSGSNGQIIRQLKLRDRMDNNPFHGAQFWIGDGEILSPESPDVNVGFWHYPKGGAAYRIVNVNGGGNTTAVTVSRASRQR